MALAPGPDNLFVLTQSAVHGYRAGLLVTFGLCTGLVVHTIAVALGVAAIFQASHTAFVALKVLGVLYLLYLAFLSFKASSSKLELRQEDKLSLSSLYRRGILMNITNPKVSIFFLAFLPQFTNPAYGSVALQITLLGLLFILAAMITFGCISFFGGVIARQFKKSAFTRALLDKVTGVVFVGLAVRLALAER